MTVTRRWTCGALELGGSRDCPKEPPACHRLDMRSREDPSVHVRSTAKEWRQSMAMSGRRAQSGTELGEVLAL